MTIWANEINELDKLYESFRGHLPDIVKEMEHLIRTDDANVVMLYARRCLEVIVTDLCESELKRPRKTEPLKGIIDKLNSEEKVPSHIITSMHSLNSMSTYGTHPKDFDPEQVKPVLNNLAIIIRWYLKYKDFKIVSKTETKEEVSTSDFQNYHEKETVKSSKRTLHWSILVIPGLVLLFVALYLITSKVYKKDVAEFNDGSQIKEVIIGEQVWMTENLKVTKFNDGTPIALVSDKKEWADLKKPAYCWYNNNSKKYQNSSFGALYNWYAVNTGKLCPTGWHVPTDLEWAALFKNVGGDDIAGDELKITGKTFWSGDGKRTTNHSGFSAVGGGNRNMYGPFGDLRKKGIWWSSSENNEITSKSIFMFSEASNVLNITMHNNFGMSVRCINDLPAIADYDNNYYKTVKIGDQIWMAENLKTTRFNDGTPIPMGVNSAEGGDLIDPAYCWKDNDKEVYGEAYGALYNWYAVNTSKLCPTGWHVPSDAEWTKLADYLGGESVAGGKLKEEGTGHWISPNSNATNESGFTALPGGFEGTGFINFGYGCYFWSSTAYNADADTEDPSHFIAWGRELYTSEGTIQTIREHKAKGFSIRCVKD